MMIQSVPKAGGNSSAEAAAAQQPNFRPATSPSPTPNFFMDGRAGGFNQAMHTRQTGSKHHHIRSDAASSQLQHHQQHTNSRLRPLPPREKTVQSPTKQMGGGMMFISGSRTGEEKVVSTVERRESKPAAVSVIERPPSQQVMNSSTNKPRAEDSQRIRKLEADLRKTHDQLKKSRAENEATKGTVQDLQSQIDTLRKENVSSLKKSEESSAKQSLQVAELQMKIKEQATTIENLQREKARLTGDNADLRQDSSKAVTDLEQSCNNLQKINSEMESNMNLLKKANGKHQTDALAMNKKIEELESQLEAERLARKHSDQMRVVELERVNAELTSAHSTLDSWKSRIQKCDEWIVQICQPSFSVVKDDQMTPMPADAPEGSGFVLVPLQLLLSGYGLLPGNTKKGIADEYEKSKKKPSNV